MSFEEANNLRKWIILFAILNTINFSACSKTSSNDVTKEKKPVTLEQRLRTIVKEFREGEQSRQQETAYQARERISDGDETIYGVDIWTEMFDAPCKYLPEALVLVKSEKSRDTNEYIILIYTMAGLPLNDYFTVWIPAVRDLYLSGRIDEGELSIAIFPPLDPRTDVYIAAHGEGPVRDLYISLLQNKRIAEAMYVYNKGIGEKFGDRIEEILSGKVVSEIKYYQEKGMIGEGRPIDLATTCEKIENKTGGQP